jgi:hopanoid biosynthesis associated RND transporter like protein HpnN
MKWRGQFLAALADAICRRPWLPVTLGLALALGAGLYAVLHLDFRTSREDLIADDSAYWRAQSEYNQEFGGEDVYLFVVEGETPTRNRRVVDTVVAELGRAGFPAEDIFYRADVTMLQPWFLYYMATSAVPQFVSQFVGPLQQEAKLATFFDLTKQMLEQMATAGPDERREMEAFVPTITAVVRQLGEPGPWASPWMMRWDGYQVFREGKTFLVMVHPRVPAGMLSADYHAATIPKLRRVLEQVRPRFSDVHVSLTGEAVLDFDEMNISQKDTIWSSVLTLVLVGIVVVAGFRDWLRMLLSLTCLVQAIVLAMGYATLSVGHLNIITITFTVMILGLGEDLGVQFISRFEEELRKGADRFGAVRGAITSTGPSIITAGVTNAAAFFAMALSDFKGVTELGIIAGGGMLIATVAMMVLLPAWLLVVRRKVEPIHMPAKAEATKVERVLLSRPHVTLAVCGAVTVVAAVLTWNVRFDSNVLNLQSRGMESVETELRLLQADGESTIYAAVVAGDLDEARDLQARLGRLPSVGVVHSIAELVPEDQEAKVPVVRAAWEQLGELPFAVPSFTEADAASLPATLGALRVRASRLAKESPACATLATAIQAARDRLKTVPVAQLAEFERWFYGDLAGLLMSPAFRPMTMTEVPPELRRMLMGKTGKFVLRVFPRENIWERDALERFVADVRGVAPKATGTPVGLYEFIAVLQRGYIKAALWAFAVIAVMVLVDLRGWRATVLTLVPLMFGIVWMTGAMAFLGLAFNPANIMALPLMVGIGVAYGVYFVQRYREDGEANFYGKSTGRAVMLSALTAVIAFASLLVGAHRGIRSLGLVMTIGVVMCLLASLTLLPALLEVCRRRGWKV